MKRRKCGSKGREILERLQRERDVAAVYHQLGMLAQLRGCLGEAGVWFQKALAICERLGLDQEAAGQYHRLGMLASRGTTSMRPGSGFDGRWPSLSVLDWHGATAEAYHCSGEIALERGKLGEAEAWFRKALGIRERLGLEREVSGDYHCLGVVVKLQGRSDEAEQWLCRALEVYRRFGNQSLCVNALRALSLLATDRGRLAPMLALLRDALSITPGHETSIVGVIVSAMLYGLVAFGEPAFTAAWREAFPDREDLLQLALPRRGSPGLIPDSSWTVIEGDEDGPACGGNAS